MIELRGLEKQYGALVALKGVSFTINNGEITGLLGPNGAGKTTLLRILTGYHFPNSGIALVDGDDITEQPIATKQKVGYLPENAPVYQDMVVLEYLRFIANARSMEADYREERIHTVCQQCSLQQVLFTPIHKLSKGFRQRVGLAQAILHDPDILILDEPTNGLDPNQIIEIRSLIRELGKKKTVILSTHVMQEVEALCDRVAIINEGALIAHGTTLEIADKLKGHHIVECMVEISGTNTIEHITDSLQATDGVVAVNSVKEHANATRQQVYTISVNIDKQLDFPGAVLYKWATGNRYELFALRPSQISLEDVFVKLTT